ncbi:fimbrial protein [Providencia manganoxydans]
MKKQLVGLSLLAACVSSSALAAGPVANIQVTGDMRPPTCTVNGGDNDLVYSFGNISPSVIPQTTTYNGLPSVSRNLTVTCDAETFLTFTATDNYPNEFILLDGQNSNFDGITFNLVSEDDITKNIGGISFRGTNVTVDGKKAYVSRANDGDHDNGNWPGKEAIVKNATTGWTKTEQGRVDIDALDLISGKVFSMNISNRSAVDNGVKFTYIYPKSVLDNNGIDISSGINYVGQAILTFNFGI